MSGASTAKPVLLTSSTICARPSTTMVLMPPMRSASRSGIAALPTPGNRSSGSTTSARSVAAAAARRSSSSRTSAASAAASRSMSSSAPQGTFSGFRSS